MTLHVIVDSDSLLYRAGFVCNEPGQEQLACWQLDVLIQDILDTTKATSASFHITGKENFRYQVYPEYKANRKEMTRPIHLEALKEHIITKWGAKLSYGVEADDEVGIEQYRSIDDTIIAHLDKDLDQLAGQHYNFNKREFYSVSNEQAMRWFFYQLIMGDRADNIPGFDGKMRAVVPKKLQHHIDFIYEAGQDEALVHVAMMYGNWERFNQSATCLWMMRKEEDKWEDWQNPEVVKELSLMGDDGQEDDGMPSYEAHSEPLLEDGHLNSSV